MGDMIVLWDIPVSATLLAAPPSQHGDSRQLHKKRLLPHLPIGGRRKIHTGPPEVTGTHEAVSWVGMSTVQIDRMPFSNGL